MVTDAKVLLGVCGLYCGACYHYRASFYDPQRLSWEAARRGRAPEGFTCQGCRSDKLYIHAGCAQCEMRACAEQRGILHCGLCAEFPCERLKAFQSDGRAHHKDIFVELEGLRDMGADEWLARQAQRWTCECGEGYNWYEDTCNQCGKPLDSYGTVRAK
jgi:predicted amidophosphoribosyltransferase